MRSADTHLQNVLAGTARGRRATYRFGTFLAPGPRGQVDTGLGPKLSSGTIGYMEPTETVSEKGGTLTKPVFVVRMRMNDQVATGPAAGLAVIVLDHLVATDEPPGVMRGLGKLLVALELAPISLGWLQCRQLPW